MRWEHRILAHYSLTVGRVLVNLTVNTLKSIMTQAVSSPACASRPYYVPSPQWFWPGQKKKKNRPKGRAQHHHLLIPWQSAVSLPYPGFSSGSPSEATHHYIKRLLQFAFEADNFYCCKTSTGAVNSPNIFHLFEPRMWMVYSMVKHVVVVCAKTE